MAEILATMAASMGATGGAAAGAAATGAAAGSSSLLTILQGAATAVTAVSAIAGGISAANASNAEAAQTELQAGQEQIQANQRQVQMRRELARILGENDVAFAAAGIDVGSGGMADQARARATGQAVADLTIDRDQDEYRRALLKVRARGLRRRAGEQFMGGLASAAGAGLGFGIDLLERG